ncbi:uncharacterized protein [Gossypium hirsutum]|uniref:Retrotransposon gag domain-containing protein n=1 Tax=Gossypium hirsutum TaxID=3635 RepID=A0A1U8NVJ2_GOSHI|nr:uncharacterized protein LOC107952243 [Gossypium hirsutum]
MEVIIGVFQQSVGANPTLAPTNPTPMNYGLPLEHLRALGGKEFSGVKGTNLTVAEYWFEGVERILKQIAYSDEEKLGSTMSLLDGKVHCWWNTIKRGTKIDCLIWDYFLEVFRRKFMGEYYMKAHKREFLDLVKGNLPVADYELVAQNTELFHELMEVELARSVIAETGKRASDAASRRPPKMGWLLCANCDHRHPEECCKFTGGYYKYGSKEHFLRDFPIRVEVLQTQNSAHVSAPARGRGHGRGNGTPIGQRILAHIVSSQVESGGPAWVYAIREPEDQDPTGVIIGTFTLRSIPLFAVVDSRSTHSYILNELVSQLGIPIEIIDLGMIVISSFGDSIIVNRVYHRCPLMIQRYALSVDRMELPFYGFNVILGMD